MAVNIADEGIEIGIVTRDAGPMVRFYRDILGLEFEREVQMANGVHQTRFKCGGNIIKLVVYASEPPADAPPGGAVGATGYRYWTIPVTNIEEAVGACEAAGCTIPVPVRTIQEGARIAMIEDPDGNWVNLLQRA
ncbi:MAG: VOC family protein [Pseudomonadota bacterium]